MRPSRGPDPPDTVHRPGTVASAIAVAGLTGTLGAALVALAGWSPVAIGAGLLAYLLLALVALCRTGAHFGLANLVTLGRAGLTCLAAGPLLAGEVEASWSLAGVVGLALALDGLDGWLARRLALASTFGARFDAVIDALLLLVLALLVWQADRAGPWLLAIALLGPAFAAAARLRPWLGRPLPPCRRRRLGFALGCGILAGCLAPPLDPYMARMAAAGALAIVGGSFALDLVWLWRTAARGA